MEELEDFVAIGKFLDQELNRRGLKSANRILECFGSRPIGERAVKDFLNGKVRKKSKAFGIIIEVLNKSDDYPNPPWTEESIKNLAKVNSNQNKGLIDRTIPLGFKSIVDIPLTGLEAFLLPEKLPWVSWSSFAQEMPTPKGAKYNFNERHLLKALLDDSIPHVLTGKGGIGKTRFAFEIGNMAEKEDWIVLRFTFHTTEQDLINMLKDMARGKVLLIVDYVETLKADLGFDRVMHLVERANQDGSVVRLLATCRKTYYESLSILGPKSALRKCEEIDLSPHPDEPEYRWLFHWRLHVIAVILECEPQDLDEDIYDIPIIAVMVRELAGKDHGLRTRADIREWLYSRLSSGIADTDPHVPVDAIPRFLPELAGFLMMFPFEQAARENLTDNEFSILTALEKDGFAGSDTYGFSLAHDLICDLCVEFWYVTGGVSTENILSVCNELQSRFQDSYGLRQSIARNFFGHETKEKQEQIKDMIASVDSLAATHSHNPNGAKDVLENCLLSLSLNLEQKRRVFAALSTLSNYQIRELLIVFNEERGKYGDIAKDSHIWGLCLPSFFHSSFAANRELWLEALRRIANDDLSIQVINELSKVFYLDEKERKENLQIFQSLVERVDNSFSLNGDNLSVIAGIFGNDTVAVGFHQRAIQADPSNANILSNFAIFLTDIRKEHDEAEKLYRRAIQADPNHANILGNFAIFLKNIRKEHDEAEKMYRRAIQADPNHANILSNFANFLTDIRKEHDEAEKLYRRAIQADPNHANILSNIAIFLTDIRKEHDEAEKMYRRAIQADPNHANILSGFAIFLTDIRKEHDEAEKMYRRAIQADPNHANILSNFANFLTDIRKEHDEAEKMYRRVIQADPNHANILSNFAIFLTDIRKEHDEAEKMYRRAIQADPNHAINLGGFANFLTDIRKEHDEAEKMYRRAIQADPNHANILSNFAIFLTDIRKEHDEAEKMYRRAIQADPNHAINLGGFANFLTDIRKEHDEAEKMYRRAIQADPNHANNLGNFANFLTDIRKEHDEAEKMYRRAIQADPNHANNLGNFAKLFFSHGNKKEAIQVLQQAEDACNGPDELRAELAFYRYAHVDSDAICTLKALVINGVRTPGWNLESNVQRAIADGHASPSLLKDVANVLSNGENEELLSNYDEWLNAPELFSMP